MSEVGFIGLGKMGTPMALRLLDAGHQLVVHDLDAGAAARLLERGAQAAGSPAEVAARVETVFASLPTPQVLEAVALGDDGVIAGSSVRRFVDLSTIGAPTSARVAKGLAERSIAMVDAPVSGGVKGAEQGTLAVMVAAEAAERDAVAPLLGELGRIFVVGEQPGMGQVMKLVNNYLSATALIASGEALAVGAKAGIDPRTMIEVVNAGTGRNSATEDKFPRAILPGTFDAGFAMGGMYKDVRLFTEQAEIAGVPLWVGSAVRQMWQYANDAVGPDADMTAIVKPVEAWAGVELRADPPDA
jgi:3-hydroxyisobutyrate dehydrogenase-like beta-hydroxyacid dehydrogenase